MLYCEKRNAYKILVGKQKIRDYLEDNDVHGMIVVLKQILKKWDVRIWIRFLWIEY
jgi:hypothetical protein